MFAGILAFGLLVVVGRLAWTGLSRPEPIALPLDQLQRMEGEDLLLWLQLAEQVAELAVRVQAGVSDAHLDEAMELHLRISRSLVGWALGDDSLAQRLKLEQLGQVIRAQDKLNHVDIAAAAAKHPVDLRLHRILNG